MSKRRPMAPVFGAAAAPEPLALVADLTTPAPPPEPEPEPEPTPAPAPQDERDPAPTRRRVDRKRVRASELGDLERGSKGMDVRATCSVSLTPRERLALGEIREEAFIGTGRRPDMSDVIRALINAAHGADLDWSTCATEQQLTAMLARALREGQGPRGTQGTA